MVKNTSLAVFAFFSLFLKAQYIGINNNQPSITLDVNGRPDDPLIADGIKLPKLTLKQLNKKVGYTRAHEGAVIYISDISGGSTVSSTSKVTAIGRYYFDGAEWQPSFTSGSIIRPEYTENSSTDNTFLFGGGNKDNSGKDNIAVGKDALSASEAGNYNAAFGHNALANNRHGSSNTAVGSASLVASIGGENTALGYRSGSGIVEGKKNIALGANSGTSGDFSNTIVIGVDSKATKDNQIVIGSAENTETILFGHVKHNNVLMYSGSPAVYNYFFAGAGRDNLSTMTSLSYGNTAAGHKALELVDNSPMNTAFGYQALQKLRDGADHTAFGAGALQSQVSGVGNSALGRLALANSVVGTNNTGLGDTALEFTLGSQNTAVGYSAGIKAVTGNFNSLFGVFAGGHYQGRNGPDGTYSFTNVFGAEAMMSNVSGSRNNLFGYRAGHVSTGADNSGFGHEVFRHLTTGGRNTAIGNLSGWRLTRGVDNTFVGYGAGQSGLQKSEVVGSTVIGAYAFSTRDNEIVIGKESDTHVTIMGIEFSKDEILILKELIKNLGKRETDAS